MNRFLWGLGSLLLSSSLYAASLKEVLHSVLQSGHAVEELQNRTEAERALIKSSATMEDPMVGLATLDRNVETKYLSISQKLRFPVKYYYQYQMQKSRYDSAKAQEDALKMGLRAEVSSLYYSLYSVQKSLLLAKANLQSLQEFARVAEKKYASGQTSQTDSMKAHFELTQLELDLIRLQQEESSLKAKIQAYLDPKDISKLDLSSLKASIPKFHWRDMSANSQELRKILEEKSPQVKTETFKLEEYKWKASLAKWEFAPDILLQYQQRISGDPSDSKIYSFGLSMPLWFWKKSGEAEAASLQKMAQEARWNQNLQNSLGELEGLISKLKSSERILEVYQTSLIPQAQSAYSSARAAYSANKTSFLDLLDSERSLYRVRTSFYQSLKLYVESLGMLEKSLGFSISDLGEGE